MYWLCLREVGCASESQDIPSTHPPAPISHKDGGDNGNDDTDNWYDDESPYLWSFVDDTVWVWSVSPLRESLNDS